MKRFKVGDLIQKNNQFCSTTRHPPMGTYGIIIHAEDWGDPVFDVNYYRIHWSNYHPAWVTPGCLTLIARAK